MANTPTIKDVQLYLNRNMAAGLTVDGEKGPETTKAVSKYQLEKMGMNPPTGILDPKTLATMFPQMDQASSRPLTIQARIEDYILNLVSSKINVAAVALVGLVVAWINTRFGFQVPQEIVNWVTGGLVALAGSLIVWWRTRGTDPSKIATVAPSVIQDPTKYK